MAKELELGHGYGLNHRFLVLQVGAEAHDALASVNPGRCALGLSKSIRHTCVEPVGAGTEQHLVNADDTEGWRPT